jgi:hypothetical protein
LKTKRAAAGVVIALMVGVLRALVPTTTIAITTSGCQCAERGTAVVLDSSVVARDPKFGVGGEACSPGNVVCQHRDATDRCDVYWIEPDRQGKCRVTVTFADGSGFDETIDFDEDEKYPCRGNVRPRRDGGTRIPGRE